MSDKNMTKHENNNDDATPAVTTEWRKIIQQDATATENKKSYHGHFDCFSGAAGDMMFGSCLDTLRTLKFNNTNDDENDDSNNSKDKMKLLVDHIQYCIEKGIPELNGEFQITYEKAWKGGLGSIASTSVNIKSIYHHKSLPVPKPKTAAAATTSAIKEEDAKSDTDNDSDGHSHSHHHHHNHDKDADNNNNNNEKTNISHNHNHDHSSSLPSPTTSSRDGHHDHDHDHGHSHSHDHNNINSNNNTDSEPHHSHDHGHSNSHIHDHGHSHSHGHNHDHSHDHNHNNNKVRNIIEIRKMITNANTKYISNWVKVRFILAFEILAYAEAYTHGVESLSQIHFHEVGAIDSIIDILGTLIALDELSITKSFTCSAIPLGNGNVWTEHGILPIPAPATLRILTNMVTCSGPIRRTGSGSSAAATTTGELVTPTGASLLKSLLIMSSSSSTKDIVAINIDNEFMYYNPKTDSIISNFDQNDNSKNNVHSSTNITPPYGFVIRQIGIGSGTKDFVNHPNIIRLIVGE